jgi:hypothetical protein
MSENKNARKTLGADPHHHIGGQTLRYLVRDEQHRHLVLEFVDRPRDVVGGGRIERRK